MKHFWGRLVTALFILISWGLMVVCITSCAAKVVAPVKPTVPVIPQNRAHPVPEMKDAWISPKVQNNLARLLYLTRDSTGIIESAFCLYGYEENDIVYFLHSEVPPIVAATDSTVFAHWDACEPGKLAWGHSHPSGRCELSERDFNLFVGWAENYTVLVCTQPDGKALIRTFSKRDLLRFLTNGGQNGKGETNPRKMQK
jgi:proteasome lid subunit RPN8/RPN11